MTAHLQPTPNPHYEHLARRMRRVAEESLAAGRTVPDVLPDVAAPLGLWIEQARELAAYIGFEPAGKGHDATCPHVRLGPLHRCKCDPVPMWKATGEISPLRTGDLGHATGRCPGCNTKIYGDVAKRGGCLACYPDLPPGELHPVPPEAAGDLDVPA